MANQARLANNVARHGACQVAEHCWDAVGLAIVQYAHRFQRLTVASGQPSHQDRGDPCCTSPRRPAPRLSPAPRSPAPASPAAPWPSATASAPRRCARGANGVRQTASTAPPAPAALEGDRRGARHRLCPAARNPLPARRPHLRRLPLPATPQPRPHRAPSQGRGLEPQDKARDGQGRQGPGHLPGANALRFATTTTSASSISTSSPCPSCNPATASGASAICSSPSTAARAPSISPSRTTKPRKAPSPSCARPQPPFRSGSLTC
jgi:hypothetical protein